VLLGTTQRVLGSALEEDSLTVQNGERLLEPCNLSRASCDTVCI